MDGKIKMDLDEIINRLVGYLFMTMFFIAVVGLVIFVPFMLFDSMYLKPIATENANKICQEKGYDFYDSYSRVGLFSKTPIAITCKYVDQYQKIDINNQGNPIVG